MTIDFAAEDNATLPEGPWPSGIDVAVIAVSGARGGDRRDRLDRSCWAAMQNYAALLSDCTALRALPIPVTCGRPRTIAARIAELPEQVAAVFVLGLNPMESSAVQAITAARGPVVVTELDVVTAALAAAAVTMLRTHGIAPRQGRVVVTGADNAPQLESVLRGAGAGNVTNFYQPDASELPIRRLMVYHHILIDLTGTVPAIAAPGRTVSVPADPFDLAAVALPGLVSALCGHHYSVLPLGALSAAARAIALITPADRTLPDPHHRQVAPAVAQHVSRILTARSAHP